MDVRGIFEVALYPLELVVYVLANGWGDFDVVSGQVDLHIVLLLIIQTGVALPGRPH